MPTHWDGSGDWGDFEYSNEAWEIAAEEGFPDWLADAADAHGVPPPDEWEEMAPFVDHSEGIYGFEVTTLDDDGNPETHWVWAGDYEHDYEAWQTIWEWIEANYPDVEIISVMS